MTSARYLAAAAIAAAAFAACGAPPAVSTPSCVHKSPPAVVSTGGGNIAPGPVQVIVIYSGNPTADWSNIIFDPEDGSAPFYGGPYMEINPSRYSVKGLIPPNTTERLLVTQRSCGVTQQIGSLTSQ